MRLALVPTSLPANPVALQLLLEAEPREPQQLGRPGLVARGMRERVANQGPFELLDPAAERTVALAVGARPPAPIGPFDVRRQVGGPNRILGQGSGAGHLVFELAHIARPIVGAQACQ